MSDMDTLNQKVIIQRAEHLVKNFLEGDSSGHDWWHIHRVRKLALEIGRKEKCNLFVCELAALLHDLIDEKLVDDVLVAKKNVEDWLIEQHVSKQDREQVISIITNLSYRGGIRIQLKQSKGRSFKMLTVSMH